MATPIRTLRISNSLWDRFTAKIGNIKLTQRSMKLTATGVIIGLIWMFVDGDITPGQIIAKLNDNGKMIISSSENGCAKELK